MKILLAVTGSISAYKSIDLARGLIKEGHHVKIVFTKGALNFVVPKLFSYLGAEEIYTAEDDFDYKGVLHVELARWSDLFIIAPLSANSLSRLARGEASDLLTSLFLAYEKNKTIAVFPAMNTEMLHHPFTQENLNALAKLKTLNNVFISPTDSGVLACNDIGEGKLPDVQELIELIPLLMNLNHKNSQKKIVISTGATISPLDPVRYLTNSSSGITGFYIAKNALAKGFKVYLIAGINSTPKLEYLKKHPNFLLTRIKTVNDMKECVLKEIQTAAAYISSAAISDIEFTISNEKIKKEQMTETLSVKQAEDILKTVLEKKSKDLKVVGFAAETDLSDAVLLKKFKSKPVDLLVGTQVNNGLTSTEKVQGFNVESADYRFMQNEKIIFEGSLSKKEMAEKLLTLIDLNL